MARYLMPGTTPQTVVELRQYDNARSFYVEHLNHKRLAGQTACGITQGRLFVDIYALPSRYVLLNICPACLLDVEHWPCPTLHPREDFHAHRMER